MASVLSTQVCCRRRERGASLVEFALIAPLLFAILLGTITGGLALAQKNSLTNAVREGGRLGATLPEGADWDTGWAASVQQRVDALASSDLDLEDICVQIIDPTAPSPPVGEVLGADCDPSLVPGLSAPDTPPSATSGCVVKVWARSEAEFTTIFFSRTLTLDGNAVGVYEREDECP
jgi:Flp pilus assembly pilin Flp